MYLLSSVITLSALFLMIFSGVVLSKKGRPYPAFLLAIHKLSSLGAIFMIGRFIFLRNTLIPMNQMQVGLVAVAGLFVLIAFITGGIISTKKPANKFYIRVHRIVPIFVVLLFILIVYSIYCAMNE
jgi:surface polysaccharide O-acyltransferase-like enzyme